MVEETSSLKEMLERLWQEIVSGLRHGFFEFSVHCETLKDKKRHVTLKAGKSFRFVITHAAIGLIDSTPATSAMEAHAQTLLHGVNAATASHVPDEGLPHGDKKP